MREFEKISKKNDFASPLTIRAATKSIFYFVRGVLRKSVIFVGFDGVGSKIENHDLPTSFSNKTLIKFSYSRSSLFPKVGCKNTSFQILASLQKYLSCSKKFAANENRGRAQPQNFDKCYRHHCKILTSATDITAKF